MSRKVLVLPAVLALILLAAGGCASEKPHTTMSASSTTSTVSASTEGEATPATSTTSSTAGTSSSVPPPILKPSGASTILVLGSDYRPKTVQYPGSSDIVMLLRVDPDADFLSILSVTRDLWVDIPGYGKDKINSAYLRGQAPLSIATVESVFGVDVDHYIVLGFTAFEAIIDSLGGAYVDVDRVYDDKRPRPIDVQPGYQLLGGADTLNFARYRFDPNGDFGRMSRQQWILSGIRDQAGSWDLAAKLPGLVSQALASVETDLDVGELVSLVAWIVDLDQSRVKQAIVRGPGAMVNGLSVISVAQKDLRQAAADFLAPPNDSAAGAASPPETDRSSGAVPDLAVWRALQKTAPFALEAPRFIPKGFARTTTASQARATYTIEAPDGSPKPAVRVLYRYKTSSFYLGVTATTWTDAPIAAKGTEITAAGTVYTVVRAGDKVHHVWWVRDEVLYVISNTVMWTVGEDDLLKMAISMTPIGTAE